jgi:hypothetical protein
MRRIHHVANLRVMTLHVLHRLGLRTRRRARSVGRGHDQSEPGPGVTETSLREVYARKYGMVPLTPEEGTQ